MQKIVSSYNDGKRRLAILAIAVIFVVFILTSCSSTSLNEQLEQYDPASYNQFENILSNDSLHTAANQTKDFNVQYTTAHFLEDLDYFLHVMENNFDLFDVAYWAHGVDIAAEVESMRETVRADLDMNVDEFFTILSRSFNGLIGGHFEFIDPAVYRSIVGNSNAWQHRFFPATSVARLSYPHVVERYRNWRPGVMSGEQYFLRQMELLSEDAFRRMTTERMRMFGQHEQVVSFERALYQGNYNVAAFVWNNANIQMNATGNIRTSVIEEGRIAFLSYNSFWYSTSDSEREQIFSFYEEIRDFDHLIIDLRRNLGGHMSIFPDIFMRPNISSPIQLDSFVFIGLGDYNTEFTDPIPIQLHPLDIFRSQYARPLDVAEMLELYDMPEITMSDMKRMDYGYRASLLIRPLRLERFDNEPAFSGKVWLLTSPLMGSATEMSARIAKNTGFATLVGERTSGNFGGPRIFVALPNTGILFQMDVFYVTDEHGRPFDAGTYPHHFNRPGLDALETVLQLIEEGVY